MRGHGPRSVPCRPAPSRPSATSRGRPACVLTRSAAQCPIRRRDHPHRNEERNVADANPLRRLGRPRLAVDMESTDRDGRDRGEPRGGGRPPRTHRNRRARARLGPPRISTPTGPGPRRSMSASRSSSPASSTRSRQHRDQADVVEIAWELWISGKHVQNSGWGNHWHNQLLPRRPRPLSDTASTACPRSTGRALRVPIGEGTCLVHFSYDDLHHFVEKLNRYTGRRPTRLEAEPTSDWPCSPVSPARVQLALHAGRATGAISGSLAFSMLYYRFLSHAKRWERLGFPDVGLPDDPCVSRSATSPTTAALCTPPASRPSRPATPSRRPSSSAARWASSPDVDHLNDLAVLMAQQGRTAGGAVAARDLPRPRSRARGRARDLAELGATAEAVV